MKNNLTLFEKDLLKSINAINGTKYNYKNLMEWSNDKSVVEKNLEKDEKMYKAFGVYVAIKVNN